MINYNLVFKSIYWPARSKKIHILINDILKFQHDLRFKKNINYDCNLILVDNKFIKKINKKFRNLNKITDVLTFVSETKFKGQKKNKICDVFISAEIISKDSKKNGTNFYDHLTHLIVHSFLHINGLMHNKFNDFLKMKNIEIKILKKLGITNPYINN